MNAPKKLLLISLGVLFVFVIILQLARSPEDDEDQLITDPYLLEGKRLAEMHCGGCHKVPGPALLPWRTWRFETLPAMAPFLGIDINRSSYDPARNPYLPENFYPTEPQVTGEEWQQIQDYYLHIAPREWVLPEKKPPVIVDTLFFSARSSTYQAENPPGVTSVKFDPGNRLIYASDFHDGKLLVFNRDLDLEHQAEIKSAISNIQILSEDWQTRPGLREFLFTFIGHLYPSDAPYGFVQSGRYQPELHEIDLDSVLISGVTRPVESQVVDLNGDGLDDLLVNEFGHRSGSLFWLENKSGEKEPEKRTIIDTPGCIQSYIMDYNRNGRPDILSLCTQTDQAVYLFSNLGDGTFDSMRLLQFEVTAGSSSFEIHDFNDDGYPDILYTSGDNADFSQVYKPYHGVYIYLNDGRNKFQQEWFFPINGAYNAKARDFDGDGHLDIAVISFFADYENSPEEGFLFFKNEGNLTFTPYHHPSASRGRWQTMDVADWTGNGREDIVLANFSMGPSTVADSVQNRWKKGPHILVLENRSNE